MTTSVSRASVCTGLVLALCACTGGGHATKTGSGSQTASGSDVAGSSVAPATAPVITDEATAQANANKPVEVRGTAEDAKLGAIVTVGKLVVYCLGHDRWPRDLAQKAVVARGTLVHTDEFSADNVEGQPQAAGTSGAVWALRSCEYTAPQ